MDFRRSLCVLLLYTLLFPGAARAQKQGNNWYFPENSGLGFATGVPFVLTGGQLAGAEGCSVISDSAGNLLFYASPTQVWNRSHMPMPHGGGLMGGNSSTQGVLIIPLPGSNRLFYIFTLDEFQNNLANGLRYSIVDMCRDGGMGDVIDTKNALLLNGTGEKMAATFHSNGTDIWLLTRKHFTNEFYAYLITSAGISSPVVSAIGWSNPGMGYSNAIGQMKISPDGSKIAFGVGNQVPNMVQLFDFNNTTGTVSNLVDLPTSTATGCPYGLSFSPDNSKLYVWGSAPTGLNQFDLSSNIPDTIIASLYNVPWSGSYGGAGLQLANNGKIYVCQPPFLGVINSPNLAGAACDFTGNAISVNSYYSLPEFIDSYRYTNGIPECNTTGFDETSEGLISIYPNPSSSEFTLEFEKALKNAVVTISDVLGRQIRTVEFSGTQLILEKEAMISGVYFITVTDKNKQMMNKKILIR
jgi:hypothetical protein